jgi:hypothetical protein
VADEYKIESPRLCLNNLLTLLLLASGPATAVNHSPQSYGGLAGALATPVASYWQALVGGILPK